MRAHQLLIWTLIKLKPFKEGDSKTQEIQCSSDYNRTQRSVWKICFKVLIDKHMGKKHPQWMLEHEYNYYFVIRL